MATIPKPTDSTLSRIWKAWEENQKPRWSKRLGASQIGRSCAKEIWFSFHWAKKQRWPGRMLRLFDTGTLEENRVIVDLKMINVEFWAFDEDGEQFTYTDLHGHAVVKLDGVCRSLVEAPQTVHTVEIKTANQKAFDAARKDGCQKAQPEHYAQIQMGLALAELDRCLYWVTNKNTDDIYIERIHRAPKDWTRIRQRASEIIFGREAPERINESPAWYQCKMCLYADICHGAGAKAERTCRSCKYSEALDTGDDGEWGCNQHSKIISHEEQITACPDHCYRREMVSSALAKEPVAPVQQAADEEKNLGKKTNALNSLAIKTPLNEKRRGKQCLIISRNADITSPPTTSSRRSAAQTTNTERK